jgi:hypothetical protein
MAWYNPLTWFATTESAEKTIDNVFDKDDGLLTQVGSWVGNMQFTDEEQAEYKMKVADKAATFVGDTLGENTERSKTRRSVAVMWIKVQLGLILMTAICIPWKKEIASDYFNLATSDVMLWGTGSIIVFFFGGYVWGAHVKKK